MKTLSTSESKTIHGGVSGGEVMLGVLIGYVGGKVIDSAVSYVKKHDDAARARRSTKTRTLTRRGYRYY